MMNANQECRLFLEEFVDGFDGWRPEVLASILKFGISICGA